MVHASWLDAHNLPHIRQLHCFNSITSICCNCVNLACIAAIPNERFDRTTFLYSFTAVDNTLTDSMLQCPSTVTQCFCYKSKEPQMAAPIVSSIFVELTIVINRQDRHTDHATSVIVGRVIIMLVHVALWPDSFSDMEGWMISKWFLVLTVLSLLSLQVYSTCRPAWRSCSCIV